MNCPLLSFWIISKFLPKQSPTRFAGAPFAQGGLFQMRYAECPGVRTLGAFLCLRDARCPWSSQSPRHLFLCLRYAKCLWIREMNPCTRASFSGLRYAGFPEFAKRTPAPGGLFQVYAIATVPFAGRI